MLDFASADLEWEAGVRDWLPRPREDAKSIRSPLLRGHPPSSRALAPDTAPTSLGDLHPSHLVESCRLGAELTPVVGCCSPVSEPGQYTAASTTALFLRRGFCPRLFSLSLREYDTIKTM